MKEITIEIKGKEWTDILDHVFEHKKKEIKVDGFRKGQVPKEIYIKKFGIESLFMDAIDHALPGLYEKMLEENKDLEMACRPSVDPREIDKDHLKVVFTIVEKPEVKLGKYKDLGIQKEEITVTDEEINHELDHLREQFVELKDKKKGSKVSDGDQAIIDFEGFKDGKPFDGGKGEDYPLTIGSNSFIPGFEPALIGMEVGEEKTIDLTFPENYHVEELKGAKVQFKVKIKELKERIYPEYNEDFFKDLNIPEVDSLEKLKDSIKEHIEGHKAADVEDKYFEECLTKVSESAKMEVPQEMIDDEIDRMNNDFAKRLEMQGMNIDTYMQVLGMTEEKLNETFKPEAEKRVKFRLVIEAVVKEEKIEVSEKETEEYLKEMSTKYNVSEEEFLKEIGGKEFLKYDLEVRKAVEIITK